MIRLWMVDDCFWGGFGVFVFRCIEFWGCPLGMVVLIEPFNVYRQELWFHNYLKMAWC